MNDVKYPQRVGRFKRTFKYTPRPESTAKEGEAAQGGSMNEYVRDFLCGVLAILGMLAALFLVAVVWLAASIPLPSGP